MGRASSGEGRKGGDRARRKGKGPAAGAFETKAETLTTLTNSVYRASIGTRQPGCTARAKQRKAPGVQAPFNPALSSEMAEQIFKAPEQ